MSDDIEALRKRAAELGFALVRKDRVATLSVDEKLDAEQAALYANGEKAFKTFIHEHAARAIGVEMLRAGALKVQEGGRSGREITFTVMVIKPNGAA